MTSKEFLLDYFEIEVDDPRTIDVQIAECFYDDICNGDIDELLKVMEAYAKKYSNSNGRRMEE